MKSMHRCGLDQDVVLATANVVLSVWLRLAARGLVSGSDIGMASIDVLTVLDVGAGVVGACRLTTHYSYACESNVTLL